MYSLYKQKGSDNWYAEINIDSFRVRKTTRTSDKNLAEQYAKKLHDDLYERRKLGIQNYYWEDAVVAYGKGDKYQLRVIDEYLAGMNLTDITQRYLEATLDDIQESREITTSSRNRYAQLIRAILNHAHKKYEDDRGNPMLARVPYIKILDENTERDRWLTRAEANRLIVELPDHQADWAAFTLYTGLRAANVLGLRWEWVDMNRRIAVIPAKEAKANRPIPVYLVPEAMAVLREQIGKHDDYVFTYHGRKVKRTHGKAWVNAKVRAGLSDVRWHDLRRTWASWHLQAGTSLENVMKLGGWASVDIVRKHYAHLAPEQMRDIAENISAASPNLKLVK